MHRKIVLNTENKQDCLLPASRSSSIGPEGRFSFFHPKVKDKEQAENGLQSRSSENGKTAVWHYGLKLQMTSEFIHEEISIMDYNGLS